MYIRAGYQFITRYSMIYLLNLHDNPNTVNALLETKYLPRSVKFDGAARARINYIRIYSLLYHYVHNNIVRIIPAFRFCFS